MCVTGSGVIVDWARPRCSGLALFGRVAPGSSGRLGFWLSGTTGGTLSTGKPGSLNSAMWGRSVIFVRTTIGLLAAAALAVAFVGQTAAAAVTAAPRVMAHKGLHYPYSPAPENSVGAILKAAARHVPIEIDILLSKPTTAHPNGVPFVFHDTTLDRMTKLRGLRLGPHSRSASPCLPRHGAGPEHLQQVHDPAPDHRAGAGTRRGRHA